MEKKLDAIRFIDSSYRELFMLPNGGSIKIIYPPDDNRGTLIFQCKFLDEMHVRVGFNDYHICEFAERMERIGARYKPEIQLKNAEIVPVVEGEEKYCTYNNEEGNTCIGHLAGDFGNDGDRFYGHFSDRKNLRDTPDFQVDLHSAVYALRQGLLKNYDSMREFCQSNQEAMLPESSECDIDFYGFKMDTETRRYFVRCSISQYSRDSRFIIYAYDKETQTQRLELSTEENIIDVYGETNSFSLDLEDDIEM